MLRHWILVLFAFSLFGATSAIASSHKIREIVEAGIVNCEGGPESIGPRFYAKVKRACLGKPKCRVAATSVASAAHLKKWHCTSIFVDYTCGGPNLEVKTRGILDRLTVKCP